MPFVPGKTIKGLLREAVEEIRTLPNNTDGKDDAFGSFEDDYKSVFFTNAELKEEERADIVANDAARYLYSDLASTAILENGIAKKHSLRKMEVVVPCTLYGQILGVPEGQAAELEKAMDFVKRMGQNRNRGLGRCTISLNEEGGKQ